LRWLGTKLSAAALRRPRGHSSPGSNAQLGRSPRQPGQ
jgi:hypothetical protein